ncbi:MAG: AAA family ATPase [Phycisphaerales bacterium]|nr:MAG: AAA family ATPase [Phycisphaerales bacterium]
MITKLSVSNFKSVRQLDIKCKKVNLFIGEPNTGKSNILEALALMSWCARPDQNLNNYVRFQAVQNFFYDQLLDHEIHMSLSLSSGRPDASLYVRFADDRFELRSGPTSAVRGTLDYKGRFSGGKHPQTGDIKFFRFKNLSRYADPIPGALNPPDGENLFSVVFGSESLREIVKEFFRKYGLRLVLRPQEKVFELQKQADDLVFGFPYVLTSDTLRRIIFYTVAIASNKESVLVFEEPESNAFPYYTKYLGERIALDQTNQFFIATHNPYLLSAVIEKARKEDVCVFISYFKDFQTRVRPLTTNQVAELMEADPFFNLDRFIEAEE